MDNLKLAFFGTPKLCIPFLDALEKSGMTPSLIVTQPDRPQGRSWSNLIAPPVKDWATNKNIPVLQPEKLNKEFYTEFEKHGPFDVAAVVAYGKIIPQKLLDIPDFGMVNVHFSLLPAWRGASPVASGVLHGDTETGVTLQKMVYKLDAGPIIAQSRIPLDGDEFASDLRMVLADIGGELLTDVLPLYLNSAITVENQDESGVTFCTKIKKEDGLIDVATMTDIELWRRYRAYHPWPGLYFFNENGKRVKIKSARFDEKTSTFVIERVIPEGKKEVDYEDHLTTLK